MERRADTSSTTAACPTVVSRRRVRLPAIPAGAADHATIYFFLQSVFRGPSEAEYQSALDDPFYEPRDRLLLRVRRRIAAHVQLIHRTMHFGSAAVAASGLNWLGVAEEYRGQGLGSHLLRAAEVQMETDGALLGMLRTSRPGFFRRSGWTVCGGCSYRRVDACALLARLLDRRLIPRRRNRYHVRPLLRWEYPALARIYAENILHFQHRPAEDGYLSAEQWSGPVFDPMGLHKAAVSTPLPPLPGCTAHGPLERTEAYWKWLLDRKAFDQFFVALEGRALLDFDDSQTRVVGYAVLRGEQIVELMSAPDRPRAALELLARCCGEAVEQGRRCILLHAPPSSPLFQFFDEAGGTGPAEPTERGEALMMRLLDPAGLLRRLGGEFDRRAAAACIPRPLELGMLVEGRKYQLELGRERVGANSGRLGRSYLRLNRPDFTRLLLGQLDWDAALAAGRLECSTALAAAAGRALFPRLPLWLPPWDDLPATSG